MIVFVVFKIHWIACRRDFLCRALEMNIIKKYMLGMILRQIVMIGIWIFVISRMTTTFIFYLITLIHLCREYQCDKSGANDYYQHPSCIFYSDIIPSRFFYDHFPQCGWIFLFGSTWHVPVFGA
jgi:hypothetical protein